MGEENFHRKFFQVAEITIEVRSDLPFREDTFSPAINMFEVKTPGKDNVSIHHHFQPIEPDETKLGKEIYQKVPWAIFQNETGFTYVWITQLIPGDKRRRAAYFNPDHSLGTIYNDDIREEYFLGGNVKSLTLFPTDQILLGRLMADRNGCILHSAGMKINGKGYLFVGHSDAGKSTITQLLQSRGKILCDDRCIVRRKNDGFHLFGTWSHGDVADVSPESAPLAGVMFLNQAKTNRLDPVKDEMASAKKTISCLIKPMVTPKWWNAMLDLADRLAGEVPCWDLYFDKSGKIGEIFDKELK